MGRPLTSAPNECLDASRPQENEAVTANPEQPVLDEIAALVDWQIEEGRKRGDGPITVVHNGTVVSGSLREPQLIVDWRLVDKSGWDSPSEALDALVRWANDILTDGLSSDRGDPDAES